MTLDEFKALTERVKMMAAGQWDNILPALAPSLADAVDRPGKKVKCPVHGGKTGSNFRAFRDVAETGGVVCNSCGTYADGLSALQWINGWTFAEAVKKVDEHLGGTLTISQAELDRQEADRRRRAEAHAKAQKEDDARLKRNLNSVWRASVPLTHPAAEPARRYFASRGLPAYYPEELRFHPAMSYWDEDMKFQGKYPCILARFRTAAGRPGTLHRIYLTDAGHKLQIGDAKKMMGHPSTVSLGGGAIRLSPTTPRILGVAEGIETALAARALHGGMAVWSCYSATLLEQFSPPSGVEKVMIYTDLDRSGRGEEAARNLQARLWEQGITAGIRVPSGEIPAGEKGIDWNDVLLDEAAAERKVA